MYSHIRSTFTTIYKILLLSFCVTFSAFVSAENLKTEGNSIYKSAYGEGYTTDGRYFNISGNYNFSSDSWGTYENASVYFFVDGIGFIYQEVDASDIAFDVKNGIVTIDTVVNGYPVQVTFSGDQKNARSKSHDFYHGTTVKYKGRSSGISNENVTMSGTLAGFTIDSTIYAYFSEFRSNWKQVEKQ